MSCEGYYLECQCDECINRETPSSAKDARIAELTAEVARYKAANADLVKTLDVIGGLSMARRVGGPDPMDLHELDRAVEMAIDMAHEAIARNALKEGL